MSEHVADIGMIQGHVMCVGRVFFSVEILEITRRSDITGEKELMGILQLLSEDVNIQEYWIKYKEKVIGAQLQ